MPLSDRKRKEGDVTPGKGGKKKRRTGTRRGQCRVLASSVGRCPDMNVQDGYGRSPERQGELPWAGREDAGPREDASSSIQHGPGVPLRLLQGGGWTDTSFLFPVRGWRGREGFL